jgi:acetylornithine deacetylase/succinyl-diaminopimelate desuccinylase-like protein
MKMTIKTTKPRNPFVVAALRRGAGSHRPGPGARRLRAARELRQEIERLRPSP